jgi:hypothetical protein
LTLTGSVWRAGCCAYALRNRPQLQNTMLAAAPPFKKFRRVVTKVLPSFIFLRRAR